MKPYHLTSINFSTEEFVNEACVSCECITSTANSEGEYRIQGNRPINYGYFYIEAQRDDYVVLSVSCSRTFKLWINHNFSGISPEMHSIMVGKIHKGVNLIVVEFQAPVTTLTFSCRISFASFEEKPHPDRLLYHNLYIEHARFTLDVKKVDWKPMGEMHFSLALNNSWNIDDKQQIKLQLVSYWDNIFLAETYGVANNNCLLILPENLSWNAYTLRASYKLLDGTEQVKDFYLYSPKLHTAKEETLNSIQQIIESLDCTKYTKIVFDYLLDSYRTDPANDDTMAQMLKYLEYFNEFGSLDSLIYRQGNTDRYFVSALDENIEKYHVAVPRNYNPEKTYALYITVATYRHGCDSDIICQCDNENVIWADISCKGYTLGSYIGEAAALEAIRDICKTYNVDTSRIYLSGSSNGGSCAWVLAKSYPHLFAGIKIVSGYVELNDLINLSNMRVLNVSSRYENMYKDGFENPQKILEQSENYSGYLAEAMNHSDLMKVRFQQDLINDLLMQKTNPWPEQVQLISTRYLHNRCYWIKIYRSAVMNEMLSIRAEILPPHTIVIYEENVSALEVLLPNEIDRKRFAIIINKKKYEFLDYDYSSVIFAKDKQDFCVCEGVKDNQSRCGIGLLNVFFYPVKIYCEKENFLAMRVAKAFSSPCGNGYDPHIYINYPINEIKLLENIDNEYHGIFIDNNLSLPLAENIRKRAIVSMDGQGFSYQNEYYEGEYAVIQLIKGEGPENDFLYINTNNVNLYQKVLFFRKFIMPTYINGFHPYLNNDALIYFKGNYYGIESYGLPLKLIAKGNKSKDKLTTDTSRSTFLPRLFDFKDKNEFAKHWILRESENQIAEDYCVREGSFIPLSGRYAQLVDSPMLSHAPYTITVTVRAYNRVGVTVNMGDDGKGYAILFLSEGKLNCLDFLNDDCVWGKHPHVNGQAFDYYWREGEWYKVKLEASEIENELRAKVWREEENEPSYWMFTAELNRMAAIHRYGTKFIRKGTPGVRFSLANNNCPQFKDVLITPQEGT